MTIIIYKLFSPPNGAINISDIHISICITPQERRNEDYITKHKPKYGTILKPKD